MEVAWIRDLPARRQRVGASGSLGKLSMSSTAEKKSAKRAATDDASMEAAAKKARLAPVEEVAELLLRQIDSDKRLDVEKLNSLAHLLSDSVVHKALGILNKKLITKVVAEPSKRHYICVQSERKSQNPYICFNRYCSCYDFSREVLAGKKIICKHLLAVRLAGALEWKDLQIRKATDVEFGEWLSTTLLEAIK